MSPRMGLTRMKVVDTAGEMADHKGIEYVTIANLAKELEIRPPSLYNHIKGLNELRTEMAVQGLNGLYSEMKSGAEGKEGDDSIQSLGASYLNYARKHPGLYEAALLAPDPRDEEVQNAGNQIVNLSLEELKYLKLSPENALHAVRGLRSLFHGFASLEHKGGFGLDLSVEESLRRMIGAFLSGMRV
ncbi:TetR/AcrR family transcriptional regulator [Bacillus salacetis]|uniref:TetR/AcrR family transcriptional regulator n=1 Tax=Bacillus salacetis TaxID=2315464 RepID=A0A3A1R2A0_9BACI|nr:TetR/AcrR family transcriptional regulator [Bacillus salacetis]RIW33310.1 TetR/AcrR family transcriptional regulator [Bacillus salacetis]